MAFPRRCEAGLRRWDSRSGPSALHAGDRGLLTDSGDTGDRCGVRRSRDAMPSRASERLRSTFRGWNVDQGDLSKPEVDVEHRWPPFTLPRCHTRRCRQCRTGDRALPAHRCLRESACRRKACGTRRVAGPWSGSRAGNPTRGYGASVVHFSRNRFAERPTKGHESRNGQRKLTSVPVSTAERRERK